MVRLLTDEQISWALVDGLRARHPDLDLVRVWDVGLEATDDREILEWAAEHSRVIITEDHDTMPGYFYDRIREGKSVFGVILVDNQSPIGRQIEDILIAVLCSTEDEFQDRIVHVPLKPPAK